jgi:hypothetical protein
MSLADYMPIDNVGEPIKFYIGRAPKPEPGYLRCVCLGDTFCRNINPPEGDIYIHTGNFTFDGANIGEFAHYLSGLRHRYKIIISGVHENATMCSVLKSTSPDILYLDGAATLINNMRIFAATRHTPLGIAYKPITTKYDIVISHIAPAGILDTNEHNEHTGSYDLLKDLKKYPPRVCIFSGAWSHGALWKHGILFINAGIYTMDDKNECTKYGVPLIVDIRTEC